MFLSLSALTLLLISNAATQHIDMMLDDGDSNPSDGKMSAGVTLTISCQYNFSLEYYHMVYIERQVNGSQWKMISVGDQLFEGDNTQKYSLKASWNEPLSTYLTIYYISPEDAGNYRCLLKNRRYSSTPLEEVRNVQIIGKPRVECQPTRMYAEMYTQANFDCTVSASPLPKSSSLIWVSRNRGFSLLADGGVDNTREINSTVTALGPSQLLVSLSMTASWSTFDAYSLTAINDYGGVATTVTLMEGGSKGWTTYSIPIASSAKSVVSSLMLMLPMLPMTAML